MDTLIRELQAKSASMGRTVLDAMYANDPFWQDRFGDRGRKMADQDTGYHVSYLVEALRANDAGVFTHYTTWLRQLLVSRGMCSQHIAEHFARLERVIDEEIADAKPAIDILVRARETLRYADGPARAVQDRTARLSNSVSSEIASFGASQRRDEQGATKRQRHDIEHLLSYLSDALAAKRPELFEAYVQWLSVHRARAGGDGGPAPILNWLESKLEDIAPARELVSQALARLPRRYSAATERLRHGRAGTDE